MCSRNRTQAAASRRSDIDSGTSLTPTGIDHLFYACADLQTGMEEIESLLGVRPVAGGRHPFYGTHNALLSLGAGTYLEVIARDPELAEPERGALVDLAPGDPSRLMTWVYRVRDLDSAKLRADEAGLGLGDVQAGSRANADGSEVRWRLTDPYALPMSGVIPFLIHWGDTEHPSKVFPVAGHCRRILLKHPDEKRVRQQLSTLKIDAEVEAGDSAAVCAEVDTPQGRVIIR